MQVNIGSIAASKRGPSIDYMIGIKDALALGCKTLIFQEKEESFVSNVDLKLSENLLGDILNSIEEADPSIDIDCASQFFQYIKFDVDWPAYPKFLKILKNKDLHFLASQKIEGVYNIITIEVTDEYLRKEAAVQNLTDQLSKAFRSTMI